MSTLAYWQQLGLDIDGEAAGDKSGVHVSLSSDGRSVAIGGWLNDGTGNESGHVRIYRLDGSDQWVQVGLDIDGEAVGDRSGYALSLSDDGKTVAIGAYKNDGNGANSGHVRIYQLNEIDEWVQVGADIDGDADHSSGFDLSLTGDGQTVVIGPAPVRVYKLNESNQWLQVGSDIAGDANSRDGLDGHSVSISSDGRTLATGAPYDDSVATNAGRARIFRLNDVDEWVQLGADFDGDTAEDQLGWNVTLAADGQTVAVGSPGYDGSANDAGRVQIYRLNDIDEWVQVGDDLYGENAGDKLGLYKTISLSDDGKTVALGGRHNDGNGDDSGHVRIYQLNDSSQWVQLSVDIDGEAAGDQFGSSVSLSSDGRTVAIGAVENDGSGDNAGHVRVYQLKQDYGASFDLASIDASSGSTLSRTGLGPYISGGGDFNGDGIDDLVFSAEGVTHTGEVVVVFGLSEGFPESVDLSTLDGTNGFVMSGIDAHDGLNPASFIGDFNGDGLDDLVLGAAAADQPGATTAGEAYIVYGQSTVSSGSLDLAGLDGTNGFTFRGIASHQHGDRVGSFVSDAGDVNNDGFDDVLITAAYGDNLGGAAYLL